MPPMRRTLLQAALAFALAGCASGRPALARTWVLGRPLDLGVSSLSGEPVAVGGATGRVRAVVLWATWCRRCFELFPALDLLSSAEEGRGFGVYAISVDEDVAKVAERAASMPPSFHVLWDRGAERLGERLGVEELPTVVLLDRQGIVRYVHDGSDERVVEEIDAELRLLLRE